MQENSTGRMTILHPFLFALYPPLALLASNILQIRPVDAIRSLVVFLLGSILIYVIVRLILKDDKRSGVVSSIIIISFSTYGQIYSYLEGIQVFDLNLGRHRFLLPIWLIFTILFLFLTLRNRKSLLRETKVLNVFAAILIALPLFQLGYTTISIARNSQLNSAAVKNLEGHTGIVTEVKPDVYYIILDMYARDDILLERYKYDNSDFLTELEEMGFKIGRCSVTNYNMTELSMASSFNMEYLQTLGKQYSAGNSDRSGLPSLIHYSRVRQIFEEMGYQFINFETGFTFTEIRDADQFLVPSYQALKASQAGISINGFESMLARTTGLSALLDAQARWFSPVADALDTRKAHVIRELFVLDTLPKLATEPSPKFVYAHILIPHPPFVFSRQGVNINYPGNDGATPKGPTPKDYASGYRNQLDYINNRIIPILNEIIQNSVTPPIIILQGDHGVDPKRTYILNAYYLPGASSEVFYPSISPVNTFRLVLNEYFNGDYEYLEDINYASNDSDPFDFRIIKDDRICE
jgi:hypothetical protein